MNKILISASVIIAAVYSVDQESTDKVSYSEIVTSSNREL